MCVTAAMKRLLDRSLGYSAASFELDDNPLQNFLGGIGFAYALSLVAWVIRSVPYLNACGYLHMP